MVVDDDVFGVRVSAAGRVDGPGVHQDGAPNVGALGQFFGRDEAEMVLVEGQKIAHVAIHQPGEHRDRSREEQRSAQQRSQGVEVGALMGEDEIEIVRLHGAIVPSLAAILVYHNGMSVILATPAHLPAIRTLLRTSPRRRLHLGDEDWPGLLAAGSVCVGEDSAGAVGRIGIVCRAAPTESAARRASPRLSPCRRFSSWRLTVRRVD